jgi:prepilin-type N-terminal cleavage/methylation domain-containing protein
MNETTTRSANRTRGFTLIEILVVITIIGLLLGLVAVAVSRQGQMGRITDCRARIAQVGLLIESYADRTGDYPPSRLTLIGVTDANDLNQGVEALVAALLASDYGGQRPNESWLINNDEDTSQQVKLANGSRALLEMSDPWDNPLVYIVFGDYERESLYRLGYDGEFEEEVVTGARNPLTGAYHQFDKYQLLSAGPDGYLGTDDDIANYEIEIEED